MTKFEKTILRIKDALKYCEEKLDGQQDFGVGYTAMTYIDLETVLQHIKELEAKIEEEDKIKNLEAENERLRKLLPTQEQAK